MSLRATTKTFEGEPCARCGCTVYYAATGDCMGCRHVYNAEYYERTRSTEPLTACTYQVRRPGKPWRACQYPATKTREGRTLCKRHYRLETQAAERLARRRNEEVK